jgi:hypothetical protein
VLDHGTDVAEAYPAFVTALAALSARLGTDIVPLPVVALARRDHRCSGAVGA